MTIEPEKSPALAPLVQLERALMDEFVRQQGYDPAKVGELSKETRDRLLTQASVYASAKLSEVEARWHFVHAIHDGGRDRSTGVE
jgi:hypothetical protein